MFRIIRIILIFIVGLSSMTACTVSKKGNEGQVQSFDLPAKEATWIHNGEPIEFEGEKWYPQDGTETFLDSEMILLDTYRGVPFFADKVDVRPFHRLYT